MARFKLTIIFLIFTATFYLPAQEEWKFSTTTPYRTVKSHFYFLEKGKHYDPLLASYTLPDMDIPQRKKEALIIKLRDILKAMHLNVEDVLDRKHGILNRNTYYLFDNEPKIYLVAKHNKWTYSKETVDAIPELYDKYVLKFKRKVPVVNEDIDKKIIQEKFVADSGKIKLDLSAPLYTISSHLIFLSDSMFDPEMAAKTINFAPEDTADAPELAIKLKQIFQGAKVKVFDFDSIPKNPDYIDTASGKHIYFPNRNLPQLFLEKIGNKWLYSRVTSKLIRSVHEEMYGSDAESVFRFSDKFKRWGGLKANKIVFAGIKLWQMYMLIYFIVIFIVIYFINRFPIKYLFYKINIYPPYRKIAYKSFKVFTFLIFFNVLEIYAPSFEFSVEYNFILLRIIHLFVIFYFTLLAIHSVNFGKEFFTRGHIYDSVFGIVLFSSLILKAVILVVSILFVIKELNYSVVNFLAGLSIGGLALALGAQDTIKNFLASLMIFADKSFSVGDWIDNGKVSGTVEEIGLRSTKIRTFYNSLVTVPNSLLSDQTIDNMGRRLYRRYKTIMVLKYDTPTEKMNVFIEKIKEVIKNHPHTRKDYYLVNMHDFDRYGIEIIIYTFFKVKDYGSELQCRQDIITKVLEFKKELNIEFSVPFATED